MLALADRADDNGFCWPSIDDLAERTKLSPAPCRRPSQRSPSWGAGRRERWRPAPIEPLSDRPETPHI
ncbi:hypothetical protein DN402_31530 [Streptomyces sp. SW4]|nr:hypothetical protein DN402_31530 [Streptomyces sp. SW4]